MRVDSRARIQRVGVGIWKDEESRKLWRKLKEESLGQQRNRQRREWVAKFKKEEISAETKYNGTSKEVRQRRP